MGPKERQIPLFLRQSPSLHNHFTLKSQSQGEHLTQPSSRQPHLQRDVENAVKASSYGGHCVPEHCPRQRIGIPILIPEGGGERMGEVKRGWERRREGRGGEEKRGEGRSNISPGSPSACCEMRHTRGPLKSHAAHVLTHGRRGSHTFHILTHIRSHISHTLSNVLF